MLICVFLIVTQPLSWFSLSRPEVGSNNRDHSEWSLESCGQTCPFFFYSLTPNSTPDYKFTLALRGASGGETQHIGKQIVLQI